MSNIPEQNKNRGLRLKIAIVWLVILFLCSFWLTVRGTSDQVSMTVIPQVPREGEPIVSTLKLNNPSSAALVIEYQFYANGELMKEGATTLTPNSSKTYRYAYENPLRLGEQLNFVVRTQSEQGDYEKLLSSPPYPPQIWSSFVSFASFSTSVMSFVATMTYYQNTFDIDVGFNVGLLYTVVLVFLLIFLEITQSVLQGKSVTILGGLRLRFNTVTWILFIIFIGLVYTKVVMILIA